MSNLSALKNAAWVVSQIRNWPRFALNWAGMLREAETTYLLRSGQSLRMRNRTTDFLILFEIFRRKDYIRRDSPIQAGSSVLEIGAHIGLFTVFVSRIISGGKCVVYEPHPDNYRLLMENLGLNRLSDVVAYRKAVAAESGQISFYESPDNTGGHSIVPDKRQASRLVDAVNLEEAVAEFGAPGVDFLKVDCEGAEHDIFQSADIATLRKIRYIAMEVHETAGYSIAHMHTLLKSRGYEVTQPYPLPQSSSRRHPVGDDNAGAVRMVFAKRVR